MEYNKNKKNKYVYLVYCNPLNPLVYGVYGNKQKAILYAHSLIEYRFKMAMNKNLEFGYYHLVGEQKLNTPFDRHNKTIFSACLKIKDGLKDFSDDGCYVKVERRILS